MVPTMRKAREIAANALRSLVQSIKVLSQWRAMSYKLYKALILLILFE